MPLLFSVLEKKGNSNTKERIDLMKRVIKLIGLERINSLTADREFIGNEWFEFLGSRKIRYFMRIKSVNKITFKNGKTYALKTLFKGLPIKQFAMNKERVTVFGQLCHISAARVPVKGGNSELLIIASYDLSSSPFEHYRERWQIETMFKGFKTSGFNFNQSHITIKKRLESLLRLMFISYIFCYKAGIWLIENEVPIKRKTHGRFEKSIFKHGLDNLVNFLMVPSSRCKLNNCFSMI